MNEAYTPASTSWTGFLAVTTRDLIAERMRATFDDQYFTIVTCNSWVTDEEKAFREISVMTGQRFTSELATDSTASACRIGWATQRVVMSIYTEAVLQRDVWDLGAHNRVQVTFDGDQMTVDQYAPAGYRLRWILAVERRPRED